MLISVLVAIVAMGVVELFSDSRPTPPSTTTDEPVPMALPSGTINTNDVDPDRHHHYGSFDAISESSPAWAVERPDGGFDCRYGGKELKDRENTLPNGDRVRRVVHREPLMTLDFADGTDYIAGVIIGGREFAAIRQEMWPYRSITLTFTERDFPHYDQPVVVCADLPEPE